MRKILGRRSDNFAVELERVHQIRKTTEILGEQLKNCGEPSNGRFFGGVQSQLVHFLTELDDLKRIFKDGSKNADFVGVARNEVQKLLGVLAEKNKNTGDNTKQLKRNKKNSIAPNIMKIAIEVSNLEGDVNDVSKMNGGGEFVENLENKISEFCAELAKIKADEGTASYKTKEDIYVTLIKCAQKLKKMKKLPKEKTPTNSVIISEISKALEENGKKINDCNSFVFLRDYQDIKNELLAIAEKITGGCHNNHQKEALLRETHALLEKLDEKIATNTEGVQTIEVPKILAGELREILKELKLVKKMIKCFSGFYKDDDYNRIWAKLEKCSSDVAKVDNTKLGKKQLQSKINGLLSRLEEKAIKV